MFSSLPAIIAPNAFAFSQNANVITPYRPPGIPAQLQRIPIPSHASLPISPPSTPTKSTPVNSPFDPVPPPDVNTCILRFRLKYILSMLNSMEYRKVSRILSITIDQIEKHGLPDIGKYSDNVLDLFRGAFLMVNIKEYEEVRLIIGSIYTELNMFDNVSKKYFVKYEPSLPRDVKELIASMV